MNRYKAALIHFVLSLLVAVAVMGLLLGLWYPPPYFEASGADRLLLLVVGVDVVLGPLLTLVVFDRRKPELKRDLAIIVALQLAALGYGFHVMMQSRPVFLVGAADRFYLISANQIEPEHLAEASQPQWRKLSWTGPVLVAAQSPESKEERDELMLSVMAGKDIDQYPRYYMDYAQVAPRLLEKAKPLSQLRKMHPEESTTIDTWLQRKQRGEESVVWLPIVTRMEHITMMMDKESGEPLGAVAVEPW